MVSFRPYSHCLTLMEDNKYLRLVILTSLFILSIFYGFWRNKKDDKNDKND